MKVSYTEDGYLKIKVEDNVKVDYTQLQNMNSLSYFVPSLKDRYEENAILYHKGEYSSVSEYVQGKVYLFKDFRGLLIVLLETFVKMEKDGYFLGNACVSLDHIFIHPQSNNIRIVYVPTKGQLSTNKNCVKELLSELLSKIQTKDSALLLGVLLENKNREIIVLDNVIKDVQEAKEKITDVAERIVEKRIEVPVEKEVYKSKNYSLFRGTVTAIEIMAGIVIPIVMSGILGSDSINLKNIVGINGIAVIITILAMVLLRDKEIKAETQNSYHNNRSITQQVQQPVTNTTQNINTVVPQASFGYENSQMTNDRNTNLNFAQNEMSNARISRTSTNVEKNKIPEQKNENSRIIGSKVQNEFEEEGTCVLYGDSAMSQAYFLESGKLGLMDRIFIDKPEFIIGRENEVDFKIDDSSVSKKHARVTNVNGKYYIEDLNSSNGTKVDTVLIKNKVELTEGSQVKLGSRIYVFHNV